MVMVVDRAGAVAGWLGAGAGLVPPAPTASLDAGDVAYQRLDVSGILAVVIAGWTTSNPTLYRAGLALQAVTPNWSRSKVTIAAGAVTTIVACFPFVFTRLLDFVGIYGLLLAPAGAIVVTEHWIFPRIGLTRYWASSKNLLLNWPALFSWFGSLAIGFALERTGALHLFFLFIPVYILASVFYILLAPLSGAREKFPEATQRLVVTGESHHVRATPEAAPTVNRALKRITGLVSLASLAACLGLAIWINMVPAGQLTASIGFLQSWLIVPTLVYFVSGTLFYQQLHRPAR